MKRVLLILLAALPLSGQAAQPVRMVDCKDYGYKKVMTYSDGTTKVIWRYHRSEPVGERTMMRNGKPGHYEIQNGRRVWVAQ